MIFVDGQPVEVSMSSMGDMLIRLAAAEQSDDLSIIEVIEDWVEQYPEEQRDGLRVVALSFLGKK